jgi:DNA polymerase-3 subunit delta'
MPFSRLFGHRRLLELLARAVARDSLPPSLIFSGPEGVGKLTTAAALAEVLNCDEPVRPRALLSGPDDARGGPSPPLELDACGACPSCRRLARAIDRLRDGTGAALDVFRLLTPDEKGSIKIDPVRDAIAATAFRPFDGRRRVIVIDDAHALEVGAQNALLKVLEEPPAGTVFVLVTSRADSLLPTIRSRCPRLRFGPLAAADIAAHLVSHGRSTPDEARSLAARADGSLGRALALARGQSGDARRVAAEVLGRAGAARAVDDRLAAAQLLIARGGTQDGKKGTGAVTRARIADRLQAMGALLRDVQVVSTRAGDRWLANADLADDLARLARAYDSRRAARAFVAVDRARLALERNVSHKAVADWLAFAV